MKIMEINHNIYHDLLTVSVLLISSKKTSFDVWMSITDAQLRVVLWLGVK
jgi:hypothetical protein